MAKWWNVVAIHKYENIYTFCIYVCESFVYECGVTLHNSFPLMGKKQDHEENIFKDHK